MSQHGAQEVAKPPTDGVSNSICSRSAGGGQCLHQEVTFLSALWSLRKCTVY